VRRVYRPFPGERRELDAVTGSLVRLVLLARPFGGTNRYHVVRPLGEGSFGAVYDVLDRDRKTHVALKLLTRADATMLYRFKAEFRAFADVHHPNLVQLYELASDGDDWFFTMELLDGVDWLTYVRGLPKHEDPNAATLSAPGSSRASVVAKLRTEEVFPPCDLDKVFACGLQLASAVQALHGAGIVHRDVKPSNVLVESTGRVVLVDFGLARPLMSGKLASAGHGIVGTPAYMAPEQAMGGEITEATDWYAMGVMLFEAMTGRLPFDGTPLEIVSAKQTRDAPRVSDVVASAPTELQALCNALLSRKPEHRPHAERVLEVLSAYRAHPKASMPVRLTPATDRALFVGRKQPMHELAAAFARTSAGATVMSLVRGASGIGKSALVRAFLDEVVEARGVVLAGRCYEREAVSYKAFDSAIDALSRFLVQLPAVECAAVLPTDAAALARVFPVLDRVPTIAQAPRRGLDAVDAQRLRSRAFAALRDLLVRLGDRRPVVLFLDDFQWADEESLALLRDLTHGSPSPAMLAVITFRDEDVGHSPPLDALLAIVRDMEAARPTMISNIALQPLSTDESRALTASALGRADADPVVAAIAGESGGSPFFLGELVQFALSGATGAQSIRLSSVLAERFARLGERERRLLEVFAIAGTPLDRRLACQAAQIDLSEAEPLFRTLHRSKLLRTTGNERDDLLECFHNRIREAIVASLSDAERCTHHQRLAAALQTFREADPEALFLHYEAAGISERAAEYALVSAARAADALAFDHAARLYGSALALLPTDAVDRNDILVRMAEALMRAGRGVESADAFVRAIDGATRRDVLAYRHRAGEQLLFCGELDRGLRVMSEICQQVGVTIPRSRFKAIVQLVLLTLLLAIRGRRYKARDPAMVTAAELTRADVCWSMAASLSLVDQVIARPFALRAVLTACEVGDADRIVRAIATEAAFRSSVGQKARRSSEALFDAARTIAAEGERPATRVFRQGVEGWAGYFLGDWRMAKPLIDASYVEFTATGVGAWERDMMAIYSLMVRIYLGELKEIAHLLEQRVYDARNRSDLFLETVLVASRANTRWMLDDTPDAKRREVDESLRRWGQPGRFQIQHWFGLQSHAQIDLYTGEPLDAFRRIEEALPALRRSFLLRVQNTRVETRSMRAFAALRVAAQGTERAEMLAVAEKDASAIASERVGWADPIAMLVRAGITRLRGNDAAAVKGITEATRLFEAQGMALHAASATLWRATIVGGDEGRALDAEAQIYFCAQGVKEPAKVAAIIVPS
jgi:hypothetical protein